MHCNLYPINMENNILESSSSDTVEAISNTHIIEEGPRICPLCSSEVRLFFIHFNEKMLMCENTECDFPFGYEDLQFVRIENDEEMSDVVSVVSRTGRFSPTTSVTGSLVSTSGWLEIDKINRVYESEDTQIESHVSNMPMKKKKKKIVSNKSNQESQKMIQKNVEDLKEISLELMEINNQKKMIKNEKWIKKLMKLQGQSGVKLLKPQELKNLKNEENLNTRELTIDIDPGDSNSLSSIKIQIANES